MTGPEDTTTREALPPERPQSEAGSKDRLVVPAIDGFRGLAALLVVLYHVSYGAGRPPLDDGLIRNVFLSGYMGVDLFFVISGFLLFLPTVTSGGRFGNVRAYALRRAARIIPAYYAALVAALFLFPLLTRQIVDLPFNTWDGLFSLILHLGFLQHTVGIALGFPEGFFVHGAVWTLSIEVGFYIVLPLIAARFCRRPFLALAVALAISVAWRALAVSTGLSASWLAGANTPESVRLILVTQFPSFFVQFAAGMTAAWIFVKLRRAHVNRLAWITVPVQVIAVVAIIVAMRNAGARDVTAAAGVYDHFTGTTFVAFGFAVLILATVLAPAWAQFPMANPVARRFGDISYGVYLWHLLLIGFALHTLNFAPTGTPWAFFRMLGFVLAGSILMGWLSLRFVERPTIRWARRRSKAIEGRTATAPARPDGAMSPTAG